MLNEPFVIMTIEKERWGTVGGYYSEMLLGHILTSLDHHNLITADAKAHIEAFKYYGENKPYYSRAESQLFEHLDYKEEVEITNAIVGWLTQSRQITPYNVCRLEHVTNNKGMLGVRYVSV